MIFSEILDRLTFVPYWFATALFVPALLLCLRHKRRKFFLLRFIPCAVAYNLMPFLIPDFFVSSYLTAGWFSFSYLICALLTAGIIMFCFDIGIINTVFYISSAYALQNTAFSLYSLTNSAVRLVDPNVVIPQWGRLIVGITAYASVYLAGYFLLIRRLDAVFADGKIRSRVAIVSFIIIAVVYVLDMWLRSRRYLNIGTYIYAIIVNTLLLSAQAGIFRESRFEREKAIMNELLRQESKQHKLSEQNINIMNIKFHDLKHRIELLRKNGCDDLGEVERAVDIYDAFVNSGNGVLDIVLSQKALICKSKGIKLGIIADGGALSFMSDTDISALFGNIMDNALEAVELVAADERMISLNVARQKGFVVIHEDNKCERQLVFENGLPLSSKNDPSFHGFGLKSIKMIAEKYGGTVSLHCQDGVFGLEILIPDPVD